MARCSHERDEGHRDERNAGYYRGEGSARPRAALWNVVLHNDRNPINRVVYRLWRTIPGMTMKRATVVTWEAHTKGRAVAKTCHKELAELYEERLRAKGLTVSAEPAN